MYQISNELYLMEIIFEFNTQNVSIRLKSENSNPKPFMDYFEQCLRNFIEKKKDENFVDEKKDLFLNSSK